MSHPPMFFDRQGNPLSDNCNVGEMLLDVESRRVAETTIETALGSVWVSTVHLVTNMNHLDGPPLIFETMVFDHGEASEGGCIDLECQRYSTEAQAIAGHEQMVAHVRSMLNPERLSPSPQD